MDEQKPQGDILDEIFSRETPPASPLSYPPAGPPPKIDPPDDIPLPPLPRKKKTPPLAQRLLPWVLGGAVLALVLCGVQLVLMNTRLDDLQAGLEEIQTVDELRKEVDELEQQLKRAEEAAQKVDQQLWDDYQQISSLSWQKHNLDYLWHIGQFMERGDYPMAALVVKLSADSLTINNPAQLEQYQSCRQELFDRGYLREPNDQESAQGSFGINFTDRWDPGKNPYMAALGILWCALDQYYVQGNPGNAAGILFVYQLALLGTDDPAIPYPQRLRNSASEYTLALYDRLRTDLAAQGYLIEEESGILKCGPALYAVTDANGEGLRTDLPFDLPGSS